MNTRESRAVTFEATAGGKLLALVPLAGGRGMARLDAEDYLRLRAAGISDQWMLNAGKHGKGPAYVRCAVRGKPGEAATVARLIVNAPKGRIVRYRNDDRMDLRRQNLFIERDPNRTRTGRRKSPAEVPARPVEARSSSYPTPSSHAR